MKHSSASFKRASSKNYFVLITQTSGNKDSTLRPERRKTDTTFPDQQSTIINSVLAQMLGPEVGGTPLSVKSGAGRLLVQKMRIAGEGYRQHPGSSRKLEKKRAVSEDKCRI